MVMWYYYVITYLCLHYQISSICFTEISFFLSTFLLLMDVFPYLGIHFVIVVVYDLQIHAIICYYFAWCRLKHLKLVLPHFSILSYFLGFPEFFARRRPASQLSS